MWHHFLVLYVDFRFSGGKDDIHIHTVVQDIHDRQHHLVGSGNLMQKLISCSVAGVDRTEPIVCCSALCGPKRRHGFAFQIGFAVPRSGALAQGWQEDWNGNLGGLVIGQPGVTQECPCGPCCLDCDSMGGWKGSQFKECGNRLDDGSRMCLENRFQVLSLTRRCNVPNRSNTRDSHAYGF